MGIFLYSCIYIHVCVCVCLSCLGALTVRLDLFEAPVESTRPSFCFGFVLFVSSSTRFLSFHSLFISSPAIPRD